MKKLEMTEELESILQSVRDGEVYADVVSVSRSGMSRRIKFYRIKKDIFDKKSSHYIQRITAEIGWLSGELEQGKYTQGRNRSVYVDGLRVSGCGMDMIFATLYNCIPFEEEGKYSQRYNTL